MTTARMDLSAVFERAAGAAARDRTRPASVGRSDAIAPQRPFSLDDVAADSADPIRPAASKASKPQPGTRDAAPRQAAKPAAHDERSKIESSRTETGSKERSQSAKPAASDRPDTPARPAGTDTLAPRPPDAASQPDARASAASPQPETGIGETTEREEEAPPPAGFDPTQADPTALATASVAIAQPTPAAVEITLVPSTIGAPAAAEKTASDAGGDPDEDAETGAAATGAAAPGSQAQAQPWQAAAPARTGAGSNAADPGTAARAEPISGSVSRQTSPQAAGSVEGARARDAAASTSKAGAFAQMLDASGPAPTEPGPVSLEPAAIGAPSAQAAPDAAGSPSLTGAVSGPAAAAAPSSAAPAQSANAAASGPPVPLGAVPMAIALRAMQDTHRFEIRLDPVDLGRIDVRLDIDRQDGTVRTDLVVDRPSTLALLQRDAGALQQALSQAGLDASGGINLSLRDGSGDGMANNQGQAQDRGGEAGRGRPGGLPASFPPDAADPASPIPARAMRLAGIDIRI